jgi:glycosyltransferase involved in cell wall biosynthesis
MKIVHVTNALHLPGNGLATTVADMVQALGGEVLLFRNEMHAAHGEAYVRAESAGRIVSIAEPRRFRGLILSPRAQQEAEAYVQGADFLVCHSFFQAHLVWTRRMARKYGVPYWVVPNGTLDPYVFRKRAALKWVWWTIWGRLLLRDASVVLCATGREASKIRERLPQAKTHVAPWPVSLPEISQRETFRTQLRRELGVGEDIRFLLYLGRLHPMKRVSETVAAFLKASCARTHLILVGPKDGIELAPDRNGTVHVLGLLQGEAKQRVLLAVDGFISLSWRENFGYTTAESLAAGLPVILSPGHDLAPEIKPADCGWFLDGFDEEEAVAAIRAFDRASEEDLRSMGSNGRAWVERKLSFRNFQETLLRIAPGAPC